MFRLLEEYRILPREYLGMDIKTRAFLAACCYIKDDAEKEFQMGDVDEDFFREFIAKIG